MCKLLWTLKLWWRNKDAYIYIATANEIRKRETLCSWSYFLRSLLSLQIAYQTIFNPQFTVLLEQFQVSLRSCNYGGRQWVVTRAATHGYLCASQHLLQAMIPQSEGGKRLLRCHETTGKEWNRTLRSTSFTEHMRQTGSNCSWRGLVKKTGRTIRKLQTIVLGGGGRSRRC